MNPTGAATVTRLDRWQPHVEVRPSATACFFCSAGLLCLDPVRGAYTRTEVRALLSTGDSYSVVLPYLRPRHLLALVDEVNPAQPLFWQGVPCRLVRARIGLPVLGRPTLRPFTLLALLPTRSVEDVPPLLRLGAEFLYANGATVHLNGRAGQGELVIP